MVQTSTIVAATVGTIATGLIGASPLPPQYFTSLLTESFVAYAVYFDHRRRTDPDFRKQLKRESRRQARAAKEEAEAHTIRQRAALKAAVEEAKEEGFPTDVEEKEAYFMNEVARGEQLSQEGMSLFWRHYTLLALAAVVCPKSVSHLELSMIFFHFQVIEIIWWCCGCQITFARCLRTLESTQ
jgi:hypothetical protein